MFARTGVLHVFLAVLLSLGGCSVPFGPGTGTPSDATLTPVAVPDDDAGGVEELAPGLADAGVDNATRLGAAHVRTLANISYTFRRNVTRRNPDGTLVLGTTTVLRRAAAGDRFRYSLTFRGRERRVIDRYADGERVYERERTPNATSYALVRVGGDPIAPQNASFGTLTSRRDVVDLFSRFRFEVVGRVERNGTTHYRLTMVAPRDIPPLRDISVRALVSERGLVREYDVSYRIVHDGEATHVDVVVRFDDLGATSVTEPPWYDAARAATNRTGPATASAARSLQNGGPSAGAPADRAVRHPSPAVSRSRSSVR